MDKLAIIRGKLAVVTDRTPLTNVDIFKMKNKLTDAQFSFLFILKRLGRPTLGDIRFPNNEIKNIQP